MRWAWLSLAFALIWLVGYLQLTIWVVLVLHPLLLWVIARHMKASHSPLPKPAPIKPLLPTESCHWLNNLIKQWMAVSSTSLLPWLKDHIDIMLSQSLPTGIDTMEMLSIDFNYSLPLLNDITVLCCSVAPPPSSHNNHDDSDRDQSHVLINANLSFDIPDNCIELRAHMGTRRCGSDVRLIISDLHLYGCVQLLLVFDRRVSYPFVSMVTITFKEKPHLWFSLRILKGLEITNIPFLHNWLYHYIVDCFTDSLVDPGQLTVNLSDKLFHSIDNHLVPSNGVLTVIVMATSVTSSYQSTTVNDSRYHVISTSIGHQKRTFDAPINAHQWRNSVSLFVCDNCNMLRLKIKRQGLLSNTTLAVHILDLNTLGLLGQRSHSNEEQAMKCYTTTVHNSYYTLVLTLQYTVLPSVSLSSPVSIDLTPQQVAGVITICVHSIKLHDVIGSCDPYCIVSLEDREVLVTDHQSDCSIAHWNKTVEVMTTNYTKPITFELLHWAGPLSTNNLIGYNKLSLDNKNAQLVRHQLDLRNHSNSDVVGTMTVSVIFRPVDTVCNDPGRVGNVIDDSISISSCESRTSFIKRKDSAYSNKWSLRRKAYKKISGANMQGVIEFSILKGRNLVPMDTAGLSNPYVEVKVGMEIVYRSKVVKHTLNPEWLEHVSLNMPSADEVITVTCWDKDRISDDFMGSLQLTRDDFGKFKTGPKWFALQMVASGDLLLSINELLPTIVQDQYDDSMATNEGDSVDGSMLLDNDDTMKRSYSDNELLSSARRRSAINPSTQPNSETTSLAETSTSTSLITPAATTTTTTNSITDFDSSHDAPITARYSTVTRDIEHALRQSPLLRNKGEMKSKSSINIIYGLAGTVLQVDGLKGDLSNIELYVKIRLNCSTSGVGLQRSYYGSRGRTIHKTRSIKGRSNPQWNDPFCVSDIALFSNSLLTIDLKSGSKVNIGTHTITLEKFFEGSLKETKWLDIGNDARLQLELSRQLHPVSRPTFLTSSPRRSSSLQARKLTKTHKI